MAWSPCGARRGPPGNHRLANCSQPDNPRLLSRNPLRHVAIADQDDSARTIVCGPNDGQSDDDPVGPSGLFALAGHAARSNWDAMRGP